MPRYLIVDVETVPIADAATYIEPVSAPSNYKDPEKIRAYIAEREAEQVAKCALDPDLCRLAAIGWRYAEADDAEPFVTTCQNEQEEREALARLWSHVTPSTVLVGYNILSFDARVLLRRSLYLNVQAPPLVLDRYRHPQIEDLMLRLCWNDPYKAHSLAFYVQRFGLPVVEDDVVGADIGALVKAGEWACVARHCRADVLRTLALAHRLGVCSTVGTEAIL